MKPALYTEIIERHKKYKLNLPTQLVQWSEYMHFMYLYNLDYSYRAKTSAIF